MVRSKFQAKHLSQFLKSINMKKVGLYVHFPFCASKCNYCNFNSYANKNEQQLKYFQALLKEIGKYKSSKFEVDTIFIGGGTPSFMFDGCISTLLSEIRKNFVVIEDAEISIEANPNSVTKLKALEWKESGVNRVSIGLQTINNNSLKLIGRVHNKQDYIRAVNTVFEAGINNVNTDCLIGLPKQKQSDVKRMLGLVNKLNCTHVSVYSLILEENTPLFDMVRNGQVKLPKEEKTLGMYNYALKFLRECGMERYEVSNFAKPGFECKHNCNTWNMHEYIGLGAGAHGFLNGIRYNNVSTIEEYISLTSLAKKPIEIEEEVSKTELFEETIMLGLRTKQGISLEKIKENFNIDLLEGKSGVIRYLQEQGLIKIANGYLSATDEGFCVLNKIIIDIVS